MTRGTPREAVTSGARKRTLSPVYYLYGEEDLLLEEDLRDLVDTALGDAERGFNYDVVDGAQTDPKEILTLASTFPMMAERRVVVVHNADRISDMKVFESYLDRPPESTLLIFVARKPDKRRTAHTMLAKKAEAAEFNRLKEAEVPGWIHRRAKDLGRPIDQEGATLLADYTGTDLREVQNELEKLIVFAGERELLTADDVQAVAGMTREINMYELHSAMGRKDGPRSLEILGRLLDGGQAPIRIAASLGHYFINLRKLADSRGSSGSAGLRLWPSLVRQYRETLTRYTDRELEDALVRIAIADEQLKSTSLPPYQIMHFLVLSILSGPGNSSGE